MPKPYSYDLRQKVIQAIELDGMKKSEAWLETCLIPSLKPEQIVIADNATFHRGGRIQELIGLAGSHLKYLPSYSPDINKIERCWSWLKSRIRKQLIQFDCLRNVMEDVLRTAS